jgi:hypothetical protein
MALHGPNERGTWLAAKLNTPLRMAIFVLFVAGMAYVLAFAGDLFYLSPQIAAMLWPANAFQLAVMLLLPRKMWPLLIAAHLTGELLHGFQIHLTPLMAEIFPLADVVTFIIAGLGLCHVFGGIPCLDSFKAFAKYFLIAVMLAPIASALVGGFGTPGLYWRSFQIWFLLNALTFLILGPAIFGWLRPLPSWTRENVHWKLEGAALFGVLVLRGFLILFSPWRPSPPTLLY